MSRLVDLHFLLFSKRIEPKRRLVGGRYGWAIHRFPIKEGISWLDIMADNVTRNNAFLQRLKARNGKP